MTETIIKKTLLFLYDYPLLNSHIMSLESDYYKVLIVQNNKVNTGLKELTQIYDQVLYVNNIYNYEMVYEMAKEIHKNHGIYRIVSIYEKTVEIAGKLRERFNIPGINGEISNLMRNKFEMKQYLNSKGVKVTNFKKISKGLYHNQLKFPLVIKPISGAATNFTYTINNNEELKEKLDRFSNNDFVAEEYVKGDEYHVDLIIQNGKIVMNSVGKYRYNVLSTIEEAKPLCSIVYPPNSIESDKLLLSLVKENEKIVRLLNVDNCICHSEFFVTDNSDIYFSEIAARMGGGPLIYPNIEHIYGINLLKATIDLEIGKKIERNFSLNLKNYSGFITFKSKKGIVQKIPDENDFNDFNNIIKVSIDKKVGDTISNVTDSSIRCGYIILYNKDIITLEQELIEAFNRFKLEVD